MTIASRGWSRGIAFLAVALLCSCGQGAVMRGKIAGLDKLANQAERNGAMRCAPRQLAIAKSQLKFAEVELDQGFLSRATDHLSLAEPNAHAAYDLSPPEKCAERQLRIARTPTIPTPTATASPTRVIRACSIPKTKTAISTKTAAPKSTTTCDALLDPNDKCPNDPEDPDGFEDKTAARISITTKTPSPTSTISARTNLGRPTARSPGARASRRSSW